jgi:type II secretion system protein H
MGHRRIQSRRGFTLLELVVVMLLLTIVMAMTAPALRNFWKGNRVKDAGDQLAAMTRLARTSAISDGMMYRLAIDEDGKGYALMMLQGQAFVLAPGHDYELPAEVQIEVMKSDGSSALWIDFHPSGRTEPATIRVSAEGHKDIVLTCHSPTETFVQVTEETQ